MSTSFDSGSSGNKLLSASSLSGLLTTGIGSGDDLRVKLKKDANGRWFPLIQHGWYYAGAEERYLFSSKQSIPIVYSSANTIATYTVSSSTLPVSSILDYGPVLLNSTDGTKSYQQVSCPIKAILPLSGWTNTSGTNQWVASVPGKLIEAYSTKLQDPLDSVPGTGYVSSDDVYHYDEATSYLTVAATGSPSGTVYVTYVSTTVGSASIQQNELHVVEADNAIRTLYPVVATADASRLPIASKLTTGGLVTTQLTSTMVGTGTTSNVLNLPTASFSPEDRVAVSYYVDESFVIDNDKLYVYATTPMTGELTYEGSESSYQDISSIPSSDLSYVQLNPIYSGVGNGFLFMGPAQSPISRADSLYVTCSPTRTKVTSSSNGFGAPVRILARVMDRDGNPVPGITMTHTIVGVGSLPPSTIFPSNKITDWNGQVVYTWKPSGSGTTTMTLSASGTSLSGSASIVQVVPKNIKWPALSARLYQKLYLFADESNPVNGRIKIMVLLTHLDGSPAVGKRITIDLESKRGSFVGQQAGSTTFPVITSDKAIAYAEYTLSGRDVIKASYVTASNVRVYSDDLVIEG